VLPDPEDADESAEGQANQNQESEGAYCDIDDHWYKWCLCGGWGRWWVEGADGGGCWRGRDRS